MGFLISIAAFLISINGFTHQAFHSLLPHQVESAVKASESFRIHIFSKSIGGETKTIVLAGETHVKTKNAHQNGVRLLEAFGFRGTEGIVPENYGLGSFAFQPIFAFTRAVANFFEDSTINNAYGLESRNDEGVEETHWQPTDYVRALKTARTLKIKFGDIRREFSENEKTHLETKLGEKRFLLPLIEKFFARYSAHELAVLEPKFRRHYTALNPLNVGLEIHHNPGLWEHTSNFINLGVITWGAYSLGEIAFMKGAPYLAKDRRAAREALARSTYQRKINRVHRFAGPLAIYWASGLLLPTVGIDNKFTQVFFALPQHGLNARNETMAGTIDFCFRTFPERKNILVVVGAAHVPGLRTLLLEQSYSEVTLSELSKDHPQASAPQAVP